MDFSPIDEDDPQYEGLNLDRGFHGTAQFEMSRVLPQTHSNWSISSDEHVNYVAEGPSEMTRQAAERSAWNWATEAEAGKRSSYNPSEWGRAVVHEVVPEGPVGPDPNSNRYEHNFDNYVAGGYMHANDIYSQANMAAESAKVTRTEWIPPPSSNAKAQGVGIQGTLPHINWQQFNAPNTGNPEDVHEDAQSGADLKLWYRQG